MTEITKKHLEEKLNIFTVQYKQATEELNKYSILVRKLEGAVEAIQILLKEVEEGVSKEETSNTGIKQENKE